MNCLRANLEIVVCDGFSFGLQHAIRIDGETLSRIRRCKKIVDAPKGALYDEKYWGLYEYCIFF
ncbi:MAG: hypothetical protein J7K83_00445 [Candidatus Aenigmarchaeota archaeon]|nr:hypothetical protein [Candidatus Aenigmarchaeota archaeon]